MKIREKNVRNVVGALVVALIAASCSDRSINSPSTVMPGKALRSEAPGVFTWLPPLGTGTATPATFDASAAQRVEICVWTGTACSGALVAQFATTPSAGVGTLAVNTVVGRYEATWSLLSTSFLTRKTYRIRVLKGSTELGAISVDVVRGRWALTRTDGTLAPLVAANDLPIQFHIALVPPPPVVFNEIESNGGQPGDWVELYNTGASAVDLGGFVFKDNDDTHSYTIPAGTMIAAGAYLVLDEITNFSFGLGTPDAARLFTPSGVIVDSYSWTPHAATTYGRCPNATGAFVTTTSSTKGTANDCSVPVRINEVESSGGTPGDWVELYNAGAASVDLSGFVFKDDDNSHSYTIPAGTTIAAGGFLVLDENTNFDFGLGGADAARLFQPSGTLVDSYTWTTAATTTYGRCPDGSGAFTNTTLSTKGTANDCSTPVKINEIESNGGTPGDWVELYNTGAVTIDLSGYVFKDDDDSHSYTIPAGTTIAAGAYLVLDENTHFSFGLGTPDAARLFNPSGTLVDSYSWTPHATTTYGRCPNGTGGFTTTASSTKGTTNDCGGGGSSAVRINEVESNLGVPGDWVELYNTGVNSVDLSGYIFRDNGATGYVIPAGTTIAGGGYLVLNETSNFSFGLGSGDQARLFTPANALVDSYTWTDHAATTYGRCPAGTGAFVTTITPTKGTANSCPQTLPASETWPGTDNVTTVDAVNAFSSNLSGLMFEAGTPDVLWAVRNGVGALFRLVFNGTIWTHDTANGWSAGKNLKYTDGSAEPDAEDVTFTSGSSAGMYVATERNNIPGTVSRPAILRFDPTAAGTTLTATNDWNLTADLPGLGANLGLEGITWVPDTYLVAKGFVDAAAGHLYNPAEYPNHGAGLFFVGVEATGYIYVYALNHATTTYTRITAFSTGFPAGVMSVHFDRELEQLWATCDNLCGGLSDIFVVDVTPGSPTRGLMKLTHTFARPSTMGNFNNEGFTFAPQSACVGGMKPAFLSDDSNTNSHALRRAAIPCVVFP